MPDYNPNLHRVTINTWGTKNNSSNGLGNYLKQILFGENIGHSSIEMTLPVTPETEQWIEIYCMEQTFQQYKETLSSNKQENLTFEQYINNAKKRIPVQHVNNNANFSRSKEEGNNSSSYYRIDFSYWPDDKRPFYLSSSEMTLPVTPETEQLIEIYCMEQTFQQYKETLSSNKQENLTFEQYINSAKKRVPVQLVNNNANFLRSKEEGDNSSSYYRIDFSYWPDEKRPFYLSTRDKDMERQRKGRHFEYSASAKESIQPEEKIRTGLFGDTHLTYAPLAIAHQRDLSDEQFAQMRAEIQLKRLESQLKIIELKIHTLKLTKIDKRFALIVKNMGLSADLIIQDFHAEEAKLDKIPEKDINERFKIYLLKRAKEQVAKAKIALNTNKSSVTEPSQYITYGILPDHTVELPYVTESGRGLNPEAMLKKMKELTEPKAVQFDLVLKNCSKTTTAILSSGTKDDPLLNLVISKEALGCIGTPQQVLVNVQNARNIIIKDKKDTFMARIVSSDPLNQWFGKFLSKSMEEETTMSQQILIALGIVGLGILKMPMAIFRAILNPLESISNISDFIQDIFKHSKSLPLKVIIGALSVALIVVLVPFALVEKTLQAIVAPFKATKNNNQKLTSPNSNALEPEHRNSSYKAIEQLIKNHTHTVKVNQSNALNILTQFEIDLEYKLGQVVTLSAEDFDTLNQYVREQNDSQLTQRFQMCCTTSLARANQLSKFIDNNATLSPSLPGMK